MKDKNIKKQENLSESDIERLELLRQANEKRGKQLTIDLETGGLNEIDELKQMLGKVFESPDEKYNIYYKGIRNTLMTYLPKGKEFEKVREIIYDEKNIFLSLGKKKSDNDGIRGGDGRMTFQPKMNEMLDVIIKWVSESQNPFVLYTMLYNLNDELGYGHENYDDSTRGFANAMKKLSEEV
jgi:hypothetical protein